MPGLNELRIFQIAAEESNFSAAARRLHLSQSAVSQAVRSLEMHYSVKLFDRVGRSVRLSEAGQALMQMSKELLTTAKWVEETMTSLHGSVVGEMNIGCSTSSGKYLLPTLVARFRRQFPEVRLNVLVHSRKGVLDRLLNGDVCFGVSSKRIRHRDLEYQPFFIDDIVLIVPADHHWVENGPISIEDLLHEPHILREPESGTHEIFIEALQEHEISQDMLEVSMILGNAEAIEMAVSKQIGVAFVSRLAAARGLALDEIQTVEIEGLELQRKIWLARNLRLPCTRAQQEFWDFVAATDPLSLLPTASALPVLP